MGAVLVANLTRPVMHGVSVRLIGNWLAPQSASRMSKQVNANGDFLQVGQPLSIEVLMIGDEK